MKFLLNRQVFLITLVISFTVYCLALTNFSLSIDEELASFPSQTWRIWLSQGRWGMGLLSALLPNFSALPIISPLMFTIGLSISALLLASFFARTNKEAIIFAGIFVASPIWLHIGEFSTLSWGVGIGLIAVGIAPALVIKPSVVSLFAASFLIAFAAAVYQSLIVIYGVVCLAIFVGEGPFWCSTEIRHELIGRKSLAVRVVISMFLAAIIYFLFQLISSKIARVQMGYVENFIQFSEFHTEPRVIFSRVMHRTWGLIKGSDPTFLARGKSILFLSWIGFFVGIANIFAFQKYSWPVKIISTIGLFIIVVATAALIAASAGSIPTRALVGFPLLYAILAVAGFRLFRKWEWIAWSIFSYSLFASVWVGTSLFYLDHVARERDAVTATELIRQIQLVADKRFTNSIPIALVGQLRYEDSLDGHSSNVEIFGESFFEHDGGSIYRVCAYLRLLGLAHLQPVSLDNMRKQLPEIEKMPIWPLPGSVAVQGNVVVVKMGSYSYQQQLLLNNSLDNNVVKLK